MLSLHLRASREQLPFDAPCDVDITAVLRNDDRETLTIYPGAARFGRASSEAAIGIEWSVELAGCAAMQPRELRTYFGPPGNPPPPSSAASHELRLAPGEQRASKLHACWVPGAVLEPRHLDATMLDPYGLDGFAAASRRVDLAKASALVLRGRVANLDRAKDDFLRGHIVGFLEEPRSYELRIGYVQEPWVKALTTGLSNVAALRFEVG